MVEFRPRMVLILATTCLALAACGDSSSSGDSTDAVTTTAAPATDPPTTEPSTTEPSTTVPAPSGMTVTDTGFAIDWSALAAKPFFALSVHLDEFFHIHTDPELDGFFLSFELYTTYGPTWTGEMGTFEINCSAASTGICVHFDPDGAGPLGDLNADFGAGGMMTINQLDESGYDIVVDELIFSDGTTITGLHMVGSP